MHDGLYTLAHTVGHARCGIPLLRTSLIPTYPRTPPQPDLNVSIGKSRAQRRAVGKAGPGASAARLSARKGFPEPPNHHGAW